MTSSKKKLRSWVHFMITGYLMLTCVALAYVWTSNSTIIREDGRVGNGAIMLLFFAIGVLAYSWVDLCKTVKKVFFTNKEKH